MVRLTTDILNGFARKEHLVAVFFDIQKAYDTTWKGQILQTIHSLGIRGAVVHFIGNFLSERKFQVRGGTTFFSKSVDRKRGWHMGGVLSVTVFAVVINGRLAAVPKEVSKSIYVDNVAIYVTQY